MPPSVHEGGARKVTFFVFFISQKRYITKKKVFCIKPDKISFCCSPVVIHFFLMCVLFSPTSPIQLYGGFPGVREERGLMADLKALNTGI